MTDLEQRLRNALKKVQHPGFMSHLQDEVSRTVMHTRPLTPKSGVRRAFATTFSVAAAVVVVTIGAIAVQHHVPKTSHDSTPAGISTSNPHVESAESRFETAASALLSEYGWQPQYADQAMQTLTLPNQYIDAPGAYPLGLFWAYHNVLSRDAGLDLTPYLGRTVDVHMIPVQHWTVGITAYDENRTTYAIVIAQQEHIIGAWISQGLNGSDYTMSLSKHFFAGLTHQMWDQWMQSEGIVNYQKGVDAERRSWTPEQVIRAYYNAIDKKDYQTAWSLTAKSAQYEFLNMNLPQGKLYNDGYDDSGEGMQDITSVKVTSIKPNDLPPNMGYTTDSQREEQIQTNLFNMKNYGQHEYKVNVVETFRKVITNGNGPQTWYVGVVKESPDAPWKISGYGSGP